MRRLFLFGLLSLLLVGGLLGCDTSTTFTMPSTSTTTTTSTTSINPSSTTTESELTLQLMEIYNLAISSGSFVGTYAEWLESVRGPAGREVSLRVADGFIQWQYTGDATWNNLVSLASLLGPQGNPGKEATFRVFEGFIQWQYVGDSAWNNLIALANLIGPSGTNGKEAVFRVSGGFLQWQYVGDTGWVNLIELATLSGPQGIPGKTITLRVHEGWIQWQYVGDPEWVPLIDLATLVGPAGQPGTAPTISINEDGYWVINGVVTTYKAVPEGSTVPQMVSVEFNGNGGLLPEGTPLVISIAKGDAMDLPIPIRDGYIFKGWVTGFSVNDLRYSSYTPFTRNTVLYALWEMDLSGLIAFFALSQSNNLTGTRTLHASILTPQGIEEYRQNSMFMIQTKTNETYIYRMEEEMSKLGEGDWIHHRMRESYEVFQGQYPNTTAIHTRIEREGDSPWHLENRNWPIEVDIDVSMFDIELFVKRPGVQIYDYPITPGLLEAIGINPDEELLIDQMSCYLDLNTSSIVIQIVGQLVQYGAPAPVTAMVTMRMIDAGTTVITLPMQEIKDDQMEMMMNLVNEVKQSMNYQTAKQQSKDQFDFLVLEIMDKIPLQENIRALTDMFWYYHERVVLFFFEIDEVYMMRYQAKEQMRYEFNNRAPFATDDSILAMQLILDEYLLIADTLNLPDQFGLLINDFYQEMNVAFVFDPLKQEIQMNRQRIMELLFIYIQIIDPLLQKPEDRYVFFTIFETHQNLINQATTKEAMRTIYESCVQEWIAAAFLFQDFTNEKAWLMSQIDQFYLMALSIIGEGDPTAIELLYLDYTASVDMEENLVVIIKISIDTYESFNVLIIDVVKADALLRIETEMNQLLPMIHQDYHQEIANRYAEAVFRIQNGFDLSQVWSIEDEFLNFLYSLPRDYWTIDVEKRIQNVTWYVSSKVPYATLDSATAMQAVLDQFILDVALLEPNHYPALDMLEQNAVMAIELAFVVSPEMQLVFEASSQAANFLYDIFWRTQFVIIFEEGQFPIFYEPFSNYIDLIYASMTIEAVWEAYENALNFLLQYPFVYHQQNQIQHIEYLVYDLNLMIQVWTQMFEIDDPLLLQASLEWVDEIKFAPSAIYASYYFLSAKKELIPLYLIPARLSTLQDLEENYLYFQQVVVESDLLELDALYAEYFLIISEEKEINELRNHIMNFNNEVNNLSFDPLKEQKLIVIYNLQYIVSDKSKSASPESMIAMNELLAEGILATQNALNSDEVSNVYYYYVQAINQAYVMDPAYVELEIERYYWIDVFGNLYNYVTPLLLQENQIPLFDDWFGLTLNHLYESKTLLELNDVVNDAKLRLAMLHLVVSDQNEMVRDGYLMRLADMYESLYGIYDDIPESITLEYVRLQSFMDVTGATIHMIFDNEAALREFAVLIFNVSLPYFKNLLLERFLEVAPYTTIAGLIALQDLYDEAVSEMDHASELWMIVQAYYDFKHFSLYVEMHPLLWQIEDNIRWLEFEFEFMKTTATEASILAMQAVIDQYKMEFFICLTMEELDLMALEAFDALVAAYIEDLDKLAFEDAKYGFVDYQFRVIHLILGFGDTPDNNVYLWDKLDENLAILATIETYEQLELLYLSFEQYLHTLPINWAVTSDELVDGLIYQLMGDYYLGNYYIFGYPYEFYPVFDAYISQFTYNIDHMTTLLQYFTFQDTIYDMVLEVMIVFALQSLDTYYLDLFYRVVGEENLDLLEELYLEAQLLIPDATDFDTAFTIAFNFYNAGDQLPQSELKEQQNYYSNLLIDKLLINKRLATTAAYDAMAQIQANATLLLFDESNVDDLMAIFAQAVSDMDDAYEEDPVKAAFLEQKHRLMGLLNMMWNYFFNQLVTDYFDQQYVSAHLTYLFDQIKAIQTEAELELLWDDLIASFFATPVTLNLSYMNSYLNLLMEICTAYYDSTDNLFGPLPESLEIAHLDAIAQLSNPDSLLTARDLYMIFFNLEESLYLYKESLPLS